MPALDYSVVADIYDRYVVTDLDVRFFQEEVRRADGPVLELMSGTGRLSLRLLDAGAQLTCVDSSPEMLAIFRQKLEGRSNDIRIVQEDVTRLSLSGRYALALIPFHSFSEITDPDEALAALCGIHRLLRPGGRLIVTLHNPPLRRKRSDGLVHEIGRFPLMGGGTLTLRSVERVDETTGIVSGQQLFDAADGSGAFLWRREVDIHFRLIAKEEFYAMAVAADFAVEALWGDYERSPFIDERSPFMIWSLTVHDGR